MTTAKDFREIQGTKDTYSKAKRLYNTRKKIEAKVKEAKNNGHMFRASSKILMKKKVPLRLKFQKPLLDVMPKAVTKQDKFFDSYDTYICLSLIGFGFCLARII